MNEITVSAKTLDDAITEASIQLGVASDQMEYDVIEKGSAGFLGIGSRTFSTTSAAGHLYFICSRFMLLP